MHLPLRSMAWSMTFPETIRALELGKSLQMFGGRPTDRAFSKF
jgi:hypothetical protein